MKPGHQKTFTILIAVFMIVTLWSLYSLNKKVETLQSELQERAMGLSEQSSQLSNHLNNVKDTLLDRISAGDSLFTEQSTDIAYENGKLLLSIRVLPKEWSQGDTVMLSLDTEGGPFQQEAAANADGSFSAVFAIDPCETLTPRAAVITGGRTYQEVLPAVSTYEALRFSYDSFWGLNRRDTEEENRDTNFYVVFYPHEEGGALPVQNADAIDLVIQGPSGVVRGRIPMTPLEAIDPESFSGYVKEGVDHAWYAADLEAYLQDDTEFNVLVEVTLAGGLSYREEVADYRSTAQNSSYSAGGGSLYPQF